MRIIFLGDKSKSRDSVHIVDGRQTICRKFELKDEIDLLAFLDAHAYSAQHVVYNACRIMFNCRPDLKFQDLHCRQLKLHKHAKEL
jgi:hypothetical protein